MYERVVIDNPLTACIISLLALDGVLLNTTATKYEVLKRDEHTQIPRKLLRDQIEKKGPPTVHAIAHIIRGFFLTVVRRPQI
jgi:hypothetical protein